jgi:type I restriction enzyme, S subunit
VSEFTLPEGWVFTGLGEFALNVNGARKPVSLNERAKIQGSYPYYGATGQIDSLNDYTHEGVYILIGEDGANLLSKSKDLAFIVSGKFWVNNHAHAIKCLAGVPEKYISLFINSIDLSPFVTGSAQPKLTKGNLENIKVPVAPLAEQKEIARKLDELLAQVDSTKTRLDAIPNILKRFRQSVLAAAVSGRLTERDGESKSVSVGAPWSHEISGLTHWTQYRFSDVVKIIGGSQPPKSNFTEVESEETIRLIQIRDYKSDKHKIFIPRTLAKRFCTKDEIMIGRYGPPIFQILRGLNGAYNVALMKAEPDENYIDREYLYWFLQNYKLFNYIEAGSDRTAGQSGVNKRFLESYPIFLPPLEEQTEIVRRVEQLFAYADQIEQRVKDAQARVNNLTQSILAKAFRGELTADWRAANPTLISGENSAEKLLQRIQAERAAITKPKRKLKGG